MRAPKIVAAFGAAAVLTCGMGVPDAAAKVVSGNDRDIPAESVDTSRPLSLVVKKVATNPFDDVLAGQKPPAVTGATFTLSRVNGIDVTTDEGRARAKDMTLDGARAAGLKQVATSRTDEAGEVAFGDLAPGLYLLEESAPDSDHEYHVSRPQLIILPLGDVHGNKFTYDNVVVTKWDGDGGETPTVSTPAPTPSPSTSTNRTPGSSTTAPSDSPDERATTTQPPATGGNRGVLASTGANVLWAAGLGVLLILIGVVLARRSKNDNQPR